MTRIERLMAATVGARLDSYDLDRLDKDFLRNLDDEGLRYVQGELQHGVRRAAHKANQLLDIFDELPGIGNTYGVQLSDRLVRENLSLHALIDNVMAQRDEERAAVRRQEHITADLIRDYEALRTAATALVNVWSRMSTIEAMQALRKALAEL